MASRPPLRRNPIMIDPTNAFGYGAIQPIASTQERLQAQADVQTQQIEEQRRNAEPDHQMYGIFGPQYAASLGRGTGASGGDILNRGALRLETDAEQAAYARALEGAQAGAERMANIEGYYDVYDDVLAHDREGIIRGISSLEQRPDGMYGMIRDPVSGMVDNQLRSNRLWAETRKDNADAFSTMSDAGYYATPETVSGVFTPPTQSEPETYGVFNNRFFSPQEENDANRLPIEQQKADADLIAAEAARTRAENGDEVTITNQWFPGAQAPVVTERGPASQMGGRPGGVVTPAPSSVQNNMMRDAAARGHTAVIVPPGILIVQAPSGDRRAFDPQGRPVQLPPSGGAQ